MRSSGYDSAEEMEPHYRQGVTKGLYAYLYLNGDSHFSGKRLLVNPKKDKTFDKFLDSATNALNPTFGAVRSIMTPNGTRQIRNVEELVHDGRYVACGTLKYKRLPKPYNAIQAHSPRRSKRHNRVDFTPPVTHSNQYQHVPSRFNQYGTGKWINCKINGYDKRIHVRLGPGQLQDMDKIHREVGETLIRHADESFFPLVSYDNKLFDSKGTEIIRVDQILNSNEDDYTIFVRQRRHWMDDRSKPNEKEKPFSIPTHSPRSHPPYLWQQSKDKEPRPRTLPPIGTKNSPDNSVRSFPDSNRKRNQVNGVPIRAAKHTKKTTKQADYDKDDGGVFKAKNQNRDTRGAREVRDTNDTKVDLPIDQVPAQEVKEEETIYEETETKVPSGIELSRQPSDSLDQQDEKIKKEKQGKDNNGRPPRQADHSHSRTVQNGDRSQGVNNAQSKTGMQNGKNSTSKSNSKTAPDQSQAKSNVKTSNSKTEVKKENPPAKENKNHNNHDAVRSSTPKDNKTAPPPQSTPSPMKDNSAEENKAATKIQANYRGHQARKEVTDLKKKKDTDEKKQREAALKAKQDKEESEAATKIQATFRGHQARKEVNNKKQVRDVRNSKEDAAATKIQAGYRGHSARKEIDAKKNKRTEKNAEEEAAATKIQAGFRGNKARKEVSEKKQARDNLQKEEDKAATKIQAGFRGHQARKEVEHKRKEKDKRDEEDWAATKIQAGFRGHQTRKDVQKKKVFSHEKLSNDFIQKSDLAVVTTDNSKCQKENLNKNDVEKLKLTKSGSHVLMHADELNRKNVQNIVTDENDFKSKQKHKLSTLNRGGTHTEISFNSSTLENKHSEKTLNRLEDKSLNVTGKHKIDACDKSKESINETSVQSKHPVEKIEIPDEIAQLMPTELAIPMLTKRECSRNSEKTFNNNKLHENDNENKETKTECPSIKLPQLHTGRSVTFMEGRKHFVRSTSLQSLHNTVDSIAELKLVLPRSQTMGRMRNPCSYKGTKSSIQGYNESLKLPPIWIHKSKSFTKYSLDSNLVDSNQIHKTEIIDLDRSKSAESSPRRFENVFPGYLVKTKTYPELLNADLEKLFPILVAKSKRHKSYPYFEVRRSESLGRVESGMRSATDSQTSDLMDLGYFETHLDSRSPGDGQSMTINLEHESIKIDSRSGNVSQIGHMGSFGDTDSIKSESVLKSSRTCTFDESVEIEWKNKDISLLNEIEDEEIELEMIKMKHLATTYIQAGIKGFLSRGVIAHKMNFLSHSEDVTILQASFRAMIYRKHLDIQAQEEDIEVQEICENDAAIKIQALYRGNRVRKLNKIKTSDKKLIVKKQVTFGEVSRIEIIDGKFRKDVRTLGNEIEDEDPKPVGGKPRENGQCKSEKLKLNVQFESDKPKVNGQCDSDKSKEIMQIESDEPNVNVKIESEEPKINVQIESEKPKENGRSESDKTKDIVQIESEKPTKDGPCESDKPKVNVQFESDKPKVNGQCESDNMVDNNITSDQNKAAKIIQTAYHNHKRRQAERKSQAVTLIQASCHSFISRQKCIEWLRQNQNKDDALAIICASLKNKSKFERVGKTSADKPALKSELVKDKNDKMQNSKIEAAKVIQSNFRGFLVRKDLKNQKERADKAAILIQTFYKAYLVRKNLKKQMEMKCRAVLRIQANVRTFLARKEFVRHKERLWLAASKIQSNVRAYFTRKEFKKQKERKFNAVKLIQTNVMAYLVRKELKKLRVRKELAVTLIQTSLRAYLARKEFQKQKERKHNAVKVIQTNVRSYLARKEYKKQRVRKLWAVSLIQTNFRAYLARKEFKKEKERKLRVVILIQANVRAYLVRKYFQRERKRHIWAANLIKANIRGFCVRKKTQRHNERLTRAVVVIQAFFRGFLVRKKHVENKQNIDKASKIIQKAVKIWLDKKHILYEYGKKRDNLALIIQKAYQRYKIRSKQKFKTEASFMVDNILNSAYTNYIEQVERERKEDAATIIQTRYRGHRSRLKYTKSESYQNAIQTSNGAVTHLQASFRASYARMQYKKRFRELNSENAPHLVSTLSNIQKRQSLEENNIIQSMSLCKDQITQNVTDLPQCKIKSAVVTQNCDAEKKNASKKSNRPLFNMSISFSSSSNKLTSIKEEKDLESINETASNVAYENKVNLIECVQFSQMKTSEKYYDPNKNNITKTLQRDIKPDNGVDVENTNNNLNKAAFIIQAAYKSYKVRPIYKNKCAKLIQYEAQTANDSLNVIKHFLCSCLQASARGYLSREGLLCYFTSGKNISSPENIKQKEISWYVSKLNSFQNGGGVSRKGDVGFNNKSFTKFQTKRLDEKVDAVTFIQAAARGYLVRRRIQKRESTKMLLRLRYAAQEEVMDILGLIHERDRAATTIQANYRGYRDRKEYKHVKVKKRKKESATLLQANIRAFLTRKDINKRLLVEMRKIDTPANRQNYSDSIDKVQASFHGYLFRKVATEKLHQILIRKDNITVVQASVRAYIDRWQIRRRQLADLARYHNAASEIQLSFKSFLERRNIGQDADKRNSSASKIQAGVRGYLARKGYLHTKRAATRIQSGYRGYKARQQYDHLARERQNSAAIVIQSRYRGYRVRNDIHIHTRRHALAQLLASARGFISREDISLRLNNMKEIEKRRAAIKIQSNYRGYAARHQYELRKRHHTNDIQKRKSITEIQAHFHGYLTRKRIEIRSRVHLNRFKSKDNSPMFLEGSLRFDLQTTGSISPIRPRTGRLRASLSNVSREQTYVIGGKFKNTNDDNLRQMAQSSSAHVDSFSHLQESFRSLLSSRRKSSKTPQQMFHESTRLKAVAHIQACFKGLLTRRLISQKYQYDKGQSQNPNPNLLTEIPSPAPQIFANPNEINLNGSYENPSSHISVNDHNVDPVPPEVSYHRQYSDTELAGRNGDYQTSDNVKTPVQYILRNNSKVDINEVRHSTPVDDSIPVQYLYRSRESTRHQYSSQTFRKMDLGRYEEPSTIQACETQIPNPVLTDRSRFEEPSPLIPSRESPIVGNSGQSVNDEVSMNTTRDRFEEPSPIPNNQTLISDMKNHDQSNSDDSINVNKHVRRYEEPSPLISHSGSPILRDTSQRVHDEISVEKNTADAITERYEEPLIIPLKHTAIGDLKSFDQSNYDTNHKFEEPSPQIQNSEIYRDSICPVKDEISPEENAVENHGERYEEPLSIENSQTTARDIQNWNNSNYDKNRRFEEPSPLPIDADASRTENPAGPRDTVRELPSHDRFMQNPSRITPISTDSEVSVETFSRKLINEVQSSVLLKDEALLILQAAFQGFLIRNRSHSQRLKKMFKMNLNDRTIFEETAVPFLQAGVKGYLAQNRDAPSPPEM